MQSSWCLCRRMSAEEAAKPCCLPACGLVVKASPESFHPVMDPCLAAAVSIPGAAAKLEAVAIQHITAADRDLTARPAPDHKLGFQLGVFCASVSKANLALM